jgi:two-component system chemotaxis response regulator CheB
MPASALANVDVDLCLPIAKIVPALQRIVATRGSRAPGVAADEVRREQHISEGQDMIKNLAAIANPSTLTCPDCGGGLWELKDPKPLRYRCHTGHAFTAQSLDHAQQETAEHGLWASVRALQERAMLLLRMARVARAQGAAAQAEAGEEQARRAHEQAAELVRMLEERSGGA